jgi:hypothetical protein
MIVQSTKRKAMQISICLGALCAAAFAQNTIPQTDPVKAYSTIGLALGETLRLDVVNIGGTDGIPPGPCNVQMGFVNAAGVLLKHSIATVPAGEAAFLTLTFAEASALTTAADSRTRVNIQPALGTVPPGPCRTVSSAEVFDAILGRTHLYAVPAEGVVPSTFPPGPPEFGIVAITPLDALRFNVTNITGSNGLPPDPCNVQMGFVNEAGDPVKTVSGTIAPGQTAFVAVGYLEAAAAARSTNALARLNLHPLVNFAPGPSTVAAAAPECLVTASAELLTAATGETALYIIPAVQGNITPPASTNGQ